MESASPGPPNPPNAEAIPPLPAAPPTYAGTAPDYAVPATWPSVIGVIGCILAAAGILQGLWAMLTPFFLDWMVAHFPRSVTAGMQSMQGFMGPQVTVGLATSAVALVLLRGSIKLLKRQKPAARMLRVWAFCKIILGVLSMALAYWMQMAQMQAMQTSNPAMATMPGGLMAGFMIFGIVVGLAWVSAFPVFVLIWLSRPWVKEQMARW